MAKVLVVDDVTADAELWSAVLQRDRHEVVIASDGAAALRACERFLPDLVITDLELQPPHGLAIIERLHAVGADVKIIAMSGSDEALHAARRLGVCTALRKPITLREFIAVTHSALHAGQMGAARVGYPSCASGSGRTLSDPFGCGHEAMRRALIVRHVVERGCQEVLQQLARAAGPRATAVDAWFAQQSADLAIYGQQCHGERDLEALGRSLFVGGEAHHA